MVSKSHKELDMFKINLLISMSDKPISFPSMYMSTTEASKKWHVPVKTITKWCHEGLIEGAKKNFISPRWMIPIDSECPKLKKE